MLKRELVRGIVISNTCVKLHRNWIINEVARAGEHTNERTYVRTYSHTYVRDRPYIPSTTLLCEGIIRELNVSILFLCICTIIGHYDFPFNQYLNTQGFFCLFVCFSNKPQHLFVIDSNFVIRMLQADWSECSKHYFDWLIAIH